MLRTLFTIGFIALVGLFVLKIVFGLLGPLVALLLWLLGVALKVALVGLLVYFVLRIFSPDSAQKLRDEVGKRFE
jgi:hypothetical protein